MTDIKDFKNYYCFDSSTIIKVLKEKDFDYFKNIIEVFGDQRVIFPATLYREIGMGHPSTEEEKFVKYMTSLPFKFSRFSLNIHNSLQNPKICIYHLTSFEMYGIWYICRDFGKKKLKTSESQFFKYANDIEIWLTARNNNASIVTENTNDFFSLSKNNWELTRPGHHTEVRVINWSQFIEELTNNNLS